MRWLVFALLLVLAGCMQTPKAVWTNVPTAAGLLDQLAANAGRYDSLDGAATVSLKTEERYLSTEQFLLLERPNRIRIDALTGFGQLIFQMSSNGEVLAALLNTTVPPRFLQGEASDENIARFIHIPLAMGDLLPILLYDPPLIRFHESRVETTSDGLTLILQGDQQRQELYFDTQLHLSGCRYARDGHDYLIVKYRDFSGADAFPYDIRVKIPRQQTRIRLKFSEVTLNSHIDSAKFTLVKPANVPTEPLP